MMSKTFIFGTLLHIFCIIYAGPQDAPQKKSGIDIYIEKAKKSRKSEWLKQLQQLKPLLSEKIIYLGVPGQERATKPKYTSVLMNYWFGNYNLIPKQYFLLNGFEDTENLFKNNHYELYFMPDDAHLYDACNQIINFLNGFYAKYSGFGRLEEYIAFIAVRPTPGITKSPFDGKPMPRIIVGFHPNIREVQPDMHKPRYTTKAHTEKRIVFQQPIYYLNKEVKIKEFGCIGIPRYSKEFEKSCIFWAYGSADFKDSSEGKKLYSPSNMVYPTKNEELFEPGWRSKTNLLEEGDETLQQSPQSRKWYKYKMVNDRLIRTGEATKEEITEFQKIKKE
jgi:hypothetical protein